MQWRNSDRAWGAIHKTLHWLIALLILSLLPFGFYMANVIPDENWQLKLTVYQYHKFFGLVVLALVMVRIVWRFTAGPRPAHPAGAPAWERRAAGAAHLALYLVMAAMPVTGYLMASASQFPVLTWFDLPDPLGTNKDLEGLFSTLHEVLGFAIAGLVAVHVAAALKHHMVDKHDVLRRMLPGATVSPPDQRG